MPRRGKSYWVYPALLLAFGTLLLGAWGVALHDGGSTKVILVVLATWYATSVITLELARHVKRPVDRTKLKLKLQRMYWWSACATAAIAGLGGAYHLVKYYPTEHGMLLNYVVCFAIYFVFLRRVHKQIEHDLPQLSVSDLHRRFRSLAITHLLVVLLYAFLFVRFSFD